MSQGQGKPTERVTRSNRTSVVDKDIQAAVSESLASPIIKQQQQRLEIVVEAAGIRFRGETPADGNCFFHAIVDQAQRLGLKLDGDHVKLRQDVCSFLKDHPSDDNGEPYANFISEAWNDYLKKMSSPGIFVDELIVRQTAKFLNVTLTIFTSSEGSVDSDAAPIIIPGEGPPMILGHYHEYHYQSLEPKPCRKTISCKYHRKGTKETVILSRKQQAGKEEDDDAYGGDDGDDGDDGEADDEDVDESGDNKTDDGKEEEDYDACGGDDGEDDDEDVDETDDNRRDDGNARAEISKLFNSTNRQSKIPQSDNHDENVNKPCNIKRKQSSQSPIGEDIAIKRVRTSDINVQSNDKSFKDAGIESSSESVPSDSLYTQMKNIARKVTGKKKQEKPNTNAQQNQRFDTVALCIVGDTKCSPDLSKKLEQVMTKNEKVKCQQFYIWQNLENSPEMSKQNIVCFIKDLVNHCVDGHEDEVEKLLFDRRYLEKKMQTEYSPQGRFLQDLGNYFLKQIWTFVKAKLSKKIGFVIVVEDTSTLVLLLNDSGIDGEGRLQKKLKMKELGKEEDMFKWTPATVVTMMIEEDDAEMCSFEKDMILNWLKKTVVSAGVPCVYPSDEALTAQNQYTCAAEEIATKLKENKSHNNKTSAILVFKQIDQEVVGFVPYCRKVFQSHLSEFSKFGNCIVLFDIRSLSSGVYEKLYDVFRDKNGNRIAVTLNSAFDPSSVPISCVVAQATITDL